MYFDIQLRVHITMKVVSILLPFYIKAFGFNHILDKLEKAMKIHEDIHHENDGWHDYEEYSGVVYKRSNEFSQFQ